MKVENLESIQVKLASPEEILSWSHGEVLKPETINYRTQRPERDGLFCERIFGPVKDYECYCGKYRRIRFKGIVCDKCGVEVTTSSVRRERMGHIKLASPVCHIWFLRGVPSFLSTLLDVPLPQLEKVIYFAAYIITNVNEEKRKYYYEQIQKEYEQSVKKAKSEAKSKKELNEKLKLLKDKKTLAEEELASIQKLKVISEVENYNLSLKYSSLFEVGTGSEVLKKIVQELDINKLEKELLEKLKDRDNPDYKKYLRRYKLIVSIKKSGIRPEWVFLEVLPVLPADLRPMVQLDGGRYASSDLNDLYRRVINRNNRLKYLLEIKAPEVIIRNEKRMLQEAVDALLDNSMRKTAATQATTGGTRLLKSLADIIKGKQGRFRQNLLGKRVDYSGRSVIVVGPELKIDECGLPKKMALEIFKPFVIHKILERELAYNVSGASRLIASQIPEVWAILDEIVKDKYVLLNRAPTLHRLGIQAFKPILIEGEAIRLHPLVCKAYNADFDGDQMAVFLPLSEQAQKEAKEIMVSSKNLLKPATGIPIVGPTKDMVLGCYWLTQIKEGAKGEGKMFSSRNEAILAYQTGYVDLRARIKVRIFGTIYETTVGRIFFNNTLPDDYPFVNEEMNSKKLDAVVEDIIDKYPNEVCKEVLDRIKELGFEYSTISGITLGMDDLIIPEEKDITIKEAEKKVLQIEEYYKQGLFSRDEKSTRVIEVWQETKSKIEDLVKKTLPPLGNVAVIINSGARGSWSQVVQMTGMKGLVISPTGKIIELPVKSSFKEGFDVLEFFISTHGARKGTVDTALRTSTAGYLTRRLVDVAHDVITIARDCGDDKGIVISKEDAEKIGQDYFNKIFGRVLLEDVKDKKGKVIAQRGEYVTKEVADKIVKDESIKYIRARSPLTCKTKRGVCVKCYGFDLGVNKEIELGQAVGIIAAQSIGEWGTQLTMRTFHTGGIAEAKDITQGLPRVEEVFEARTPVNKAEFAKEDGKVIDVKDELIKIQDTKGKVKEYKVPAKRTILVKKGQIVKKGDQLYSGSLDIRELFETCGEEVTKKYILNEIQQIYYSQGASINDKHVELIIRQMFSRVQITDPGETGLIIGEVLPKYVVLDINDQAEEAKKQPAKYKEIVLGITKVALTTDSFLSAASFQETSRVLIKASLEGKEDKLFGLKENVIIGKLIPVGTGFQYSIYAKQQEKEK
ncbi:DNA-directed RNA polymerase subunit beta' [bacterium HR34]|nr:DNA-directed RNA polymerase subunit beta' [bacterium HR34]